MKDDELFIIQKLALIKKIYTKNLSEKSDEKLTSVFAIFADAINKNNFSSQQELSNYLGCNKAHTSRTLLKMQIKGLIKPTCKAIALTEKGKKFAEDVKEARIVIKNQLFTGVSDNELHIFSKVIDKMILNVKTMCKQ